MREKLREVGRGERPVASGLVLLWPQTPCMSLAALPGGPGFPWLRSSFPANSMGSRSSRLTSGRRAFNDKVNNCIRGASVGGAE